jgi:hypothetical protein
MNENQNQQAATAKEPITDIKLKLDGEDGNAWSIMGRARQALRRNGRADLIDAFTKECTSGDYNNLLALCCALSYVASFCFSSYLLALGPPFTT